jgi:hypothetical protein
MKLGDHTAYYFGDKKKLLFLASGHSIKNNEIKQISNLLKEYDPQVILLEGGFENAQYKTIEEAVQQGVEFGCTNFLAGEMGITLKGNDPPIIKQYIKIAKSFGLPTLNVYHCLHFLNSRKVFISLEGYIKNNDYFKKEIDSLQLHFSYEEFLKHFKEIYREPYNPDGNYNEYFSPFENISILNDVAREIDIYRDKYMLDAIKKNLSEVDRVMVVKGEGHLRANWFTLHRLMDKLNDTESNKYDFQKELTAKGILKKIDNKSKLTKYGISLTQQNGILKRFYMEKDWESFFCFIK